MINMEDFLNTAHWLLLPFGPFILVVLLAIPCAIIALLVNIIIKLIKMAKKRDK
jgi:hypothetical protein